MSAASALRRLAAPLLIACIAPLAHAQGARDTIYVTGLDLLALPAGVTTLGDLTDERWADAQKGPLQFFCSQPGAAPVAQGDTQLPRVRRCDALRRITTALDEVQVVRLDVALDKSCKARLARDADVQFVEAKRSSLLGEQLKTVLEFVANKASEAPPALVPQKVWCPDVRRYTLRHERALLTVKASYKGAAEGDAGASLVITTGPAEHLFLSGDAVVRGANEVKWDAGTRTLVARDKPEQLYLGFNYMVGDLFQKHDGASLQRLVFKVMVQPSRKPFDDFGVGVGYRFADGVFNLGDKQDNGGFMVFGGAFWTRNDALDDQGAVVKGKLTRSWRVGVSYSLDALLGWIK